LSDFSYQVRKSGGVWFGTLRVIDKTGEAVAVLVATVDCSDRVEFSIKWKRERRRQDQVRLSRLAAASVDRTLCQTDQPTFGFIEESTFLNMEWCPEEDWLSPPQEQFQNQ
jgi:hypothetical protein